MRKHLLLFALLAIVLAACRIESNVTLTIDEDGSATVGAEVGFDDEFRDLISQSGADPDEILGDLPSFGEGDTQTFERVDGDMTFYGVTTEVSDLSTFDMGSAQGDVFSSFSYTFDDESAQLDATLVSADIGDLGGDLPIDPSQITDDIFSASVIVKMPGTVTQHNADEVLSDGSLVWNIPFTGTQEITATSDFTSSNTNLILFILIGVLVIGIIAAIVATIVSRKESRKAVDAAAASHAAAVSEDTASDVSDAETVTPATVDTSQAGDGAPEGIVDAAGAEGERTIEVTIEEDAAEPPSAEPPSNAEQRWESEGGHPDST
jgi:hypothetical protein